MIYHFELTFMNKKENDIFFQILFSFYDNVYSKLFIKIKFEK